jgi:hypothetical protein
VQKVDPDEHSAGGEGLQRSAFSVRRINSKPETRNLKHVSSKK